jgi:hypothetical protein
VRLLVLSVKCYAIAFKTLYAKNHGQMSSFACRSSKHSLGCVHFMLRHSIVVSTILLERSDTLLLNTTRGIHRHESTLQVSIDPRDIPLEGKVTVNAGESTSNNRVTWKSGKFARYLNSLLASEEDRKD